MTLILQIPFCFFFFKFAQVYLLKCFYCAKTSALCGQSKNVVGGLGVRLAGNAALTSEQKPHDGRTEAAGGRPAPWGGGAQRSFLGSWPSTGRSLPLPARPAPACPEAASSGHSRRLGLPAQVFASLVFGHRPGRRAVVRTAVRLRDGACRLQDRARRGSARHAGPSPRAIPWGTSHVAGFPRRSGRGPGGEGRGPARPPSALLARARTSWWLICL